MDVLLVLKTVNVVEVEIVVFLVFSLYDIK